MDPDGDYESRHSIRSTASDNGPYVNPSDDVASPSKIFAPDCNIKLPAKATKDGDAYDGPTAPPMEDAPPPAVPAAAAAAASPNHRSAMESRGTAYDAMMSGKMDLPAPDEAPISNSVAVPIGFDSDDMALPEAKALPIINSAANEGTKEPSVTLEEVDIDDPCTDTEIQIDEQTTGVLVASSEEEDQISSSPDETSDGGNADQGIKKSSSTRSSTGRQMLYCCGIIVFFAVIAIVALFGTPRGQLLIKGVPNCDLGSLSPLVIGNGWCNGQLNTEESGWDGETAPHKMAFSGKNILVAKLVRQTKSMTEFAMMVITTPPSADGMVETV